MGHYDLSAGEDEELDELATNSPASGLSARGKKFKYEGSRLMAESSIQQCFSNICYAVIFIVVGTLVGTMLLQGKTWFDHTLPSDEFQMRHVARDLGCGRGCTKGGIGVNMAPVYFSDIRGMDDVKLQLMEIVDFYRNPIRYTRMGARMPKGILLEGKPGTGKTMLARAVATESNVTTFIFASGSEFVEVFVGKGAKRVRELFAYARMNLPAIVFIDELDALGSRRGGIHGNDMGGSHREADQTLNQLLVELDGFTPTANMPLIVLGASNRVDVLDPALTRAGRFDRIVHVTLPDVAARMDILSHYLNKVSFEAGDSREQTIRKVARATVRFSGADLANVVNEAALLAVRSNATSINEHHLTEARDNVAIGPERRSLVMTERQRRMTAYHEAGHALIAYRLQPDADPILKASIITRGNALGHVEQIPLEDKYTLTFAEAKARLAVAMAGRVAEELTFGMRNVSSGASSDFRHATSLAQKMVYEWGMSRKIGPYHYAISQPFPRHVISETLSEQMDEEVRGLLLEAYEMATKIIKEDWQALRRIAEGLMTEENLDNVRIQKLVESSL